MILQTKEHLLHYMMKGYVHLSKKDYGFFNNLTYMVKDNNQVTSNQNKLFDKLIIKYQRQLRKAGFKIEELQKLEWNVKLVDSSEHYLVPKIYLDNDELCMRTPFNSKFIQSLKVADDNTFIWNKDQKIYRSKFYTHALRIAYDLCKKHFDRLEMSAEIQELLKDVWVYEGVNLAPILSVDEGKYYIKNINENLAEAVKEIKLNNDPNTLYQLSRYGVMISEDIINDDPVLRFASNFSVKIDIDEFINKPEFFKELNIKQVCAPARYLHRGVIKEDLLNFLRKNNIEIYSNLEDFEGECVFIAGMSNTTLYNVELSFGRASKRIAKIVMLNNSRPIEVK